MRPESVTKVPYFDAKESKNKEIQVTYVSHSTFSGATYKVLEEMLHIDDDDSCLESGNNLIITMEDVDCKPIVPDDNRLGWVAKYLPVTPFRYMSDAPIDAIFVISHFS